LTVSGTTTTINTETILLADNIITLNSNFTTGTPTENAGIEVRRGSLSTVSFYWDESNDRWTADNTLSVSGNVVLSGTIDTGQGATEVYLMNQNIRTTDSPTFAGLTLNGDLTLSYTYPRINLTDTNNDSDYSIINADGSFVVYDVTNNANRFTISNTGLLTHRSITGGTAGSTVAGHIKNFSLGGGSYNSTWNSGNSVMLYIEGYSNDAGDSVYPVYIEDENNIVDFYLFSGTDQSLGTKQAYIAGNTGIGTAPNNSYRLNVGGSINIPNDGLLSVNNEPNTWGARFRTTTSTTNLGAQLKNIIWTGGGTNEGFAVSGVGTGGAALEVRNDGIVWAKSSVYSNAAGNGGAFYLSDTAAGIYRDNTYDVTVIQNNSSGNILNLASAGDVRVSIDSNNNDTGVRFIVGNNAIKSTNELFSVNESGVAYASSDFRAPIFYDSDNTSYYTNPLSTSRLNALQVNKTYQNEQYIDVPGTFNGNRRWVRFSISRFNSGGSPVRLSISRAISDNGSNPYGGCTAEFVINSREWHSGQENMWYFYTEHGSYNANQNPYGYYIYQAGPRDLAGSGYWFYMLLLDGVRYRMSVSADMNFNNDNIGSIEYSVADPGGVPRVPLGSGVIGNNTTYNQTTSTYAMHSIMYDYDDRNYYIDPNSTSRIRKTNLVASGTSWDDGLNLYSSDESNRWNLLVDNGASDYLRFAYNNSEDFRLQPDATISYNSMYAPIYYDLDDSTYYTNPANGGFVLQGGSSNRVKFYTNDSGFRVQNPEGNGVSDVRLGAAWGAPGVYSSTYLMLGSENYVEFRIGNSQKGYMDSSSNLYSFGSVRSPIYYDYTSTAYYLDPASTSNLNEVYAYSYRGNGNVDTGYFLNPASTATSLRIQGGIKQRNIVGRPYAVWGATGATGAVIIKFPGGTGNYGMIHAVIDIYEYNGNAAATVIVGGHNWNGAWYNYNANVVGYTDKQVRVGVKDGRYCIVIGTGGSSWSYGQVVLRKIQNGTYYDGVMDVAEGYSAAIESDSYSWISGDLQVLRSRDIYGVNYVQAPIFYDTNSTYYFNGDSTTAIRTHGSWRADSSGWDGEYAGKIQYHSPASTNNFNQTEQNGRMWYSNYLVSRNSGGLMGDYNNAGTSAKVIWTIGESWPLGNMYGLGYEYGSGYGHHLALKDNGTTYSRLGFAGGAFIGGTVSVGGAMYAPIYYDSNDGGYYGDFASTSRTNYIVGNRIKLVNNVNNEPRWDFSAYVVEAQHWYGNNSSMTMYMGEGSNTIQVPGSGGIRPQIIYDYNDNGWYLNMDGTSNLNRFTQRTHAAMNRGYHWITPRFDYTSDVNYWTGTFGWGTSAGNWDNAWKSGFGGWDIWGGGTGHPQGGGYVHAQGIVSGQHYASSDGGSAYGWQMVGAHDAGSRWWLRGKWGGTTYPWYEVMLYDRNIGGGTFYAGYWYDGNNTGYYIDPNGSSQMSAVYANDWFRAQGCAGFYFQSYSRGLWSPECEGNPYGHVATNGGGRNGWGGYGIFSRYTLMSTGGDNVGMHDSARGWVWYMSGGELNLYYAGSDRASMRSHGIYAHSDVRAAIYYDHDTGYYFDGNGTSNMNRFTDRTKASMGNTAKYNSPRWDFTGDSNYWVGSMGWGTTDLNSVWNWGSGFFDSWGNPGNQPAGTSHWTGIQTAHYTCGYGCGYGWQMVGGPISGLWFRNVWSSPSGWRKIAMYGLNEYSSDFYATIVYDSNNTGFYSDPNGTSALSRITVDSEIISRNGCGRIYLPGNLHIDSYCGYSIYMNYYTNQWMRYFGPSEYYGNGIYGVGEIYSNIFYDRNDSGYRLDPNGTSQLHYVLANNWFRPQGCTGVYWESYGRGIWSPECEGNPYGHIATYGGGRNGWYGYGIGSRYTFMSTMGDNVGLHDSARGWIWYMSGAELNMYYAGSRRMVTTGWGVYVDQYLEAGGSLRAPIFYDNQDTGYYLDQHNTDNQGLRIRGGTLHGPNWWWGAYLRVGANNHIGDWAQMFTSNGNLHIDARPGYPMYLNWHTGNTVLINSDVQARIYYDLDDTGYYFGSSSGDGRFRYTNTNGGFSQPNYEFQFVTNRAYYVNDTNTANLQACANSNLTAFFSWHKYGVFATNMGLDVDNVIRIGGWSMGANRWQLTPGGDMYAAGNIIAYSSDERLKENITTISDALGMLKRLRGVYFDWKDIVDDLGFNPVDRHDIGVIAQEVEKVIPQAIKPAPFDALSDGKSISGQNYKTVQLEKIVPVLIQSVKEQQEIIEKQNKEIEELKTIVHKILNKN